MEDPALQLLNGHLYWFSIKLSFLTELLIYDMPILQNLSSRFSRKKLSGLFPAPGVGEPEEPRQGLSSEK